MRGSRFEAGREPIGAAYDERRFNGRITPRAKLARKFGGRPAAAALVERNQARTFGQCGFDSRTLGFKQLFDRYADAFLGFDFDQLDAIVAA